MVALADNPAFSLFQITGPPGAVQVMQGDKPILDIHASAHFERASHENAHLSAAYLCKQFLLAGLGICIMDKGDFSGWDTAGNELGANIIIDAERRRSVSRLGQHFQRPKLRAVKSACSFGHALRGCGLWGGNVAKYKLGQLIRLSVPPDLEDVSDALVDLAFRVIRQHGI